MVPPKNCSPREQSISVYVFHFVKCLRSHQAMSNTILHNKPLLRLLCYGEAYCQHIPIVTLFVGCFAQSSVTWQLFLDYTVQARSIDTETNKLFNDVLQMPNRWHINHVSMFFIGHEWSVGDFQTPVIQTAVTRQLFYQLRCARALLTWKRTSFPMMYYFFPIGGTPLAYELTASNFGTRFVFHLL